ncbi:MAG: heparinase II/III family protein, partial [Planctomycetes bacterium]|nr:heparinase II/III family protein [Planctomycetota bacterium]
YGFGHYVMLAETIRQATGGGVDLMARPEVKAPASFAARIRVIGGVAPAFADCDVGSRPLPTIMWFVNRRFGLGLAGYRTLDLADCLSALPEAMLYAFPNAATAVEPAAEAGPALRDWFPEAGVLIGRPAPGSACRVGVALKGGHNAEHHNHNDVGSYVVVVSERPGGDGRGTPVLLDPGRETYTARTFSGRRYDSKLLNSFGHPVPVVAGKLQETGRKAAARVVRTDFTDKADTLVLDLRAAYAVADCKTLERTFVYSRDGAGGLAVTDRVAFAAPQAFATALITPGKWKRLDAGSIEVTDGKASVRVDIDTGGEAFTVEAEEIVEDAPVKPTRISVSLTKPVAAASVTLKITLVAP